MGAPARYLENNLPRVDRRFRGHRRGFFFRAPAWDVAVVIPEFRAAFRRERDDDIL